MSITSRASLTPIAVLARPASGWSDGPLIHHMILTAGRNIFHNTPEFGEHLATWDEAVQGLPIRFWKIPVSRQNAALERLISCLTNPAPYHAFSHNCQHTVSWIANGVVVSHSLNAIGAIAVGASILFSLN